MACRTVAVKLMLIDSGAIDEAKEIDAKLTVAENRAAVLASYESRLKRAPMAGFAPGDVKAYRKSVVKQFLKVQCNNTIELFLGCARQTAGPLSG